MGDLSEYLSGRDIADICKDAERRWASKYIWKEVDTIIPNFDVYADATVHWSKSMKDSNLRMENDHPSWLFFK